MALKVYANQKYSKYILRFEYKWGTKIANNFDAYQYDAGCYYHVIDALLAQDLMCIDIIRIDIDSQA